MTMGRRIIIIAALSLVSTTYTTSSLKLWGSQEGDTPAQSDAIGASSTSSNGKDNYHFEQSDPIQNQEVNDMGQPTYGLDVSFPIHHLKLSTNYAWLPHNVDPENNPTPPEYKGMNVQYLGNKQAEYDEFIKGCDEHYGQTGKAYSACRVTEEDRVEMSLRQPAAMQNYTELGFKKIKAPKAVWEQVKKFWDNNKDKKNWKNENWPKGNTYTNHVSSIVVCCVYLFCCIYVMCMYVMCMFVLYISLICSLFIFFLFLYGQWIAPTYMVSVEDTRLRGAGVNIKRKIWNAAKDTLQEWTQEELTECSLYGIRVYTEGSILATHVDRMPLVSSAILNVDQDVDEPWPIEVYAHDGKAYNITMVSVYCSVVGLTSIQHECLDLHVPNPFHKTGLASFFLKLTGTGRYGIIRKSFCIARSAIPPQGTLLC